MQRIPWSNIGKKETVELDTLVIPNDVWSMVFVQSPASYKTARSRAHLLLVQSRYTAS